MDGPAPADPGDGKEKWRERIIGGAIVVTLLVAVSAISSGTFTLGIDGSPAASLGPAPMSTLESATDASPTADADDMSGLAGQRSSNQLPRCDKVSDADDFDLVCYDEDGHIVHIEDYREPKPATEPCYGEVESVVTVDFDHRLVFTTERSGEYVVTVVPDYDRGEWEQCRPVVSVIGTPGREHVFTRDEIEELRPGEYRVEWYRERPGTEPNGTPEPDDREPTDADEWRKVTPDEDGDLYHPDPERAGTCETVMTPDGPERWCYDDEGNIVAVTPLTCEERVDGTYIIRECRTLDGSVVSEEIIGTLTPEPTPEPTATPDSTETPTGTETETPTGTETGTATEPESTPEPTATPRTPTFVPTTEPTATPRTPTRVPTTEPEPTAEPTETPTAVHSGEITVDRVDYLDLRQFFSHFTTDRKRCRLAELRRYRDVRDAIDYLRVECF